MPGSKYERATFWVGVLAIVVTILVWWLARQDNIQLARDTGQFRTPQLAVGLTSFAISSGDTTEILFGAASINEPKAVLIGAVPLTFTNSGDRTLDNLTVTFRYNKLFRRKALEAMEIHTAGSAQASNVKHTFTEDDQFEYSSYELPALDPRVSFVINEPIYLASTLANINVPFETRDQKQGIASFRVDYSLQFLLSVTARDTAESNYTLSVSTVPSSSMDDLMKVAKQSRVAVRARDLRQAATFPQYLRALLFGVPEERLYLVPLEFDSWPAEDGRLYHARPGPKVRQLSYTPVSWKNLL